MKKQFNKFQWVNLFMTGLIIFLCVSMTQAQDLPYCWDSDDIGDVLGSGSATFDSDVFTVEGSGADIYGVADAFHFAYLPADGDCEIIAKVESMTETAPDAKACVMIRETLTPGSPTAQCLITPSKGLYFQFRETLDLGSSNENGDLGKSFPVWLKLKREADTFTASYSDDGEIWTDIIPHDIVMAVDAYVGLAVTAHNNDSICQVVFESVKVESDFVCEEEEEELSINNVTSNVLSIYPNPVTDIVTLEISDNYFTVNNSVSIFNNLGQLVRKENVNNSQHLLDLSDIPQGLYFIELKNDQGSVVKKLIKK